MKLIHILDDLFGSKSKVRIIRLLFRYTEREFTEREIARQIAMSQNTVNIALQDLTKTNVFLYRKIGKANVYIVNKKSVLFSFLQNIFTREGRIREDLIKRIGDATSPLISCILFGSYALNSERHDSDLDLLVVAKDKKKAKVRLDELERDLLREYNIPLSIVLLTPRELINKWNTPYMKQVRKDGIRMSGKLLEEVYGKRIKNSIS